MQLTLQVQVMAVPEVALPLQVRMRNSVEMRCGWTRQDDDIPGLPGSVTSVVLALSLCGCTEPGVRESHVREALSVCRSFQLGVVSNLLAGLHTNRL